MKEYWNELKCGKKNELAEDICELSTTMYINNIHTYTYTHTYTHICV